MTTRDDYEQAAAASATIADARAFMRGEYFGPAHGTLAAEIDSYARGAQAIAVTLALAAIAFALFVVIAIWPGKASAQVVDRIKPAAPTFVQQPEGLYIDQTAPQRYCVIESGVFNWFGRQTFLHCASGWNVAGHTFVSPQLAVGQEYPLYRLQADAGLLSPVVVTSVTITGYTANEIYIRFGSPGAQTNTYALIRQ